LLDAVEANELCLGFATKYLFITLGVVMAGMIVLATRNYLKKRGVKAAQKTTVVEKI